MLESLVDNELKSSIFFKVGGLLTSGSYTNRKIGNFGDRTVIQLIFKLTEMQQSK